ncbi:MAG: RNA polymerase sigma factor [Bacteroidota bacterium]
MDQKELIPLLKKGDEQAFKVLIDKHQKLVYNTVLSFVKSEEDADDLAQEVFLEVFQSVSSFRGDSKLSTWLYRIAVTKSLEHIRKIKRKKRFTFLTGLWNDRNELIHQPVDWVHPGIQLENKEHAKALFLALDKLPEQQKTTFLLHKVEGLPYQEIANILETSLSSVESLMFRAKQNLKKILKNYYEKEL